MSAKVIKLPRKKAMSKKTPEKDHLGPDEIIIRECMLYAANSAAGRVIYKIDPTDSRHAEAMDAGYLAACRRSLRRLSKLNAVTCEGVNAKARIVSLVIQDCAFDLDAPAAHFLETFAEDVNHFSKPMMGVGGKPGNQAAS